MGELVKTWNDGAGSLTVAYDGDRDGSSVFSSDINEGIDREIGVSFVDKDRTVVVDRTVKQIGLREVFNAADGAFILADGGTFNVLKPIQYTPLEYIESTGTQYIDTGANIDTSTDEIEVVIQGLTQTTYKWFLGEHDNGSRFGFGSGDGANKRNVAYGNSTYKVTDSQVYDTKHTLVANTNGLFLDGAKIANYASFVSTSTIYLFHLNLNGQSSYMGSSRIWSYKHRRNGALLLDLIPALDSDGVACMLDKVSRAFFYSKTDEGFVAGPIKHPLPIGCKELTYIESTGTQYIDTQLPSSVKSSVDVVFSFSSMAQSGANNAAVFGGRDGQTSRTFTLFKIASTNPQYLRFDYNSQRQVATSEQMSWEADHQYRFTYDGVTSKTVNLVTSEAVSSNIAPSNLGSIYPIALFAVNTQGTIGTFMKGRIYQFTYSDGENHIDLIPAIDTNGVVCMFDRVSGNFFYNKGTGTFIAGEPK